MVSSSILYARSWRSSKFALLNWNWFQQLIFHWRTFKTFYHLPYNHHNIQAQYFKHNIFLYSSFKPQADRYYTPDLSESTIDIYQHEKTTWPNQVFHQGIYTNIITITHHIHGLWFVELPQHQYWYSRPVLPKFGYIKVFCAV